MERTRPSRPNPKCTRLLLDEPAELLRDNWGAGRHWLTLELEGVRSNRDGMNARTARIERFGLLQSRDGGFEEIRGAFRISARPES